MKNKIITKRDILMLIIGGILLSASIVLADTIASSLVIYDTTVSGKSYDTVQGALDDLYRGLYDVASTTGTGLSLIVHTPKGLSSELIAGLYRFQGVQDANNTVDNYICFGTTSKSDCIGAEGDPDRYDRYMYRIIGINASGQLKLIKKEALNTAYKWNSSTGADWVHSDLYAGLNGSYFLTNTTYVPDSSWSNRIVASDWHYGDITNANVDSATMASTELGATNIANAKIGLMYLHDYYYGLEGGNNCSSSGSYSTCKNSWIHLSKNDTSAPKSSEWTMSRRDNDTAWPVHSSGNVNGNYIMNSYTYSVRPVFYLRSGEKIASGSGAIDDPFILA